MTLLSGMADTDTGAGDDPGEFDGHWIIAQTFSHHEAAVAERLRYAGVSCYLPVETHWRRSGAARRRVELPLIPGYVFAAPVSSEDRELMWGPGIYGRIEVVGQGQLREELHRLWVAQSSGDFLERAVESMLTRRCRILPPHGLADTEGEVESRAGKHRLILRITTLGQSVAVEIDPEQLEIID